MTNKHDSAPAPAVSGQTPTEMKCLLCHGSGVKYRIGQGRRPCIGCDGTGRHAARLDHSSEDAGVSKTTASAGREPELALPASAVVKRDVGGQLSSAPVASAPKDETKDIPSRVDGE